MAGIYIHIPFCKQACFYCDFHFSTNQKLKDEMVNGLAMELTLQKDYIKNEKIKTIYFGGGTPSLLTGSQMDLLLTTIYKNFSIAENPEVTLEANPDDLSPDKLMTLSRLNINRLSIGAQSFNNNVLKYLNRAHNVNEAIACIENAHKAGIHNISLDLIYAIPDRDNTLWKEDLDQAVALAPQHISSYCLTIEPDTVFGRWFQKGRLKTVTDDLAADQFDILVNTLDANGYEQYEVSNFCKEGYESIHNSSYWKQEKYLGIGPSAHSYDLVNRQFNVSHNKKYLDAITQNKVPYTLDKLTREDKINDYLLTTLRTKWGADLRKLKRDYQYEPIDTQATYIKHLIKEEKAVIVDNHLILTKAGLLLADQISADLFV